MHLYAWSLLALKQGESYIYIYLCFWTHFIKLIMAMLRMRKNFNWRNKPSGKTISWIPVVLHVSNSFSQLLDGSGKSHRLRPLCWSRRLRVLLVLKYLHYDTEMDTSQTLEMYPYQYFHSLNSCPTCTPHAVSTKMPLQGQYMKGAIIQL